MIDLGLGWLWAIGVGVIALAATWLGGRKAGRTDAKVKGLQDAIKGHEVRNEIEAGIDLRSDARKRLHERWSK